VKLNLKEGIETNPFCFFSVQSKIKSWPAGKTREHFRFSVAIGTFYGQDQVPLIPGTQHFPWDQSSNAI
jgi:hypothetical protein